MGTTPTEASRSARTGASAPWLALALVACAALAIAGSAVGRPALGLAAIVLLLAAWLPRAWRRRSAAALGAWAVVAVAATAPAAFGHPALAWSLLPVAVPAAVAWAFARTLRRGREPLVTRCVRVIEGDAHLAHPGVRDYTRGVTVFWTAWLAGIALLSLVIVLFAAPGGWLALAGVEMPLRVPGSVLAWYPEAGCWALLALAFAGEYVFRRWRLRGAPPSNPVRFVVQLVRRWPALVADGDGPA